MTIMVIMLLDSLMFDQISLSSQVKGSVIINDKNGMYELPHKLLNEFRLVNLTNCKIPQKFQNMIEFLPPLILLQKTKFCQYQQKNPAKHKQNFSRGCQRLFPQQFVLLVGDLRLKKRFSVRIQLLAMCRGELSAVISQLMSNCLSGGRTWQ